MQPPLWPQIALQVILLLLTAFFSAAELSIPAQDEGALRRQAQEGDRKAAQLLRLAGRPVRTRATIQLCVTLSGFCSAACAALSFGLPLGRWAVARWALSGNGAYAVRVLAAAGVTLVTALIVLVLCALLVLFLGTRLGLSIRATGDNADMVRASSINPNFTITVGLCVANAMTGLSGAMVAQYSTYADVNNGTGMVVLALAALVIGETLIGKGSMVRRVLGVVAGSIIYRFIYAAALRFNVPADYMKLVSAIIVGVAIAAPAVKRWAAFQIQKRRALAGRGNK